MGMALYLFYLPSQVQNRQFEDLPWQVQVVDPGRTRVLGITLGETTMAGFQARMTEQTGRLVVPEIRLFVDSDGTRTLEAYYVNVRIPPFEANLILQLDLREADLDRLEAETTSERPMPSGARRYGLSDAALGSLGDVPIVEMSYIPRASWTLELLRERFGEPARQLRIDADHEYWLYPDQALAILVPRRGRMLMHYVTRERWGDTVERLHAEGRRRLGEDQGNHE
ncbi:MAG: hypothetical protein ACQETK_09095 [Pseudomonadota bacterium]